MSRGVVSYVICMFSFLCEIVIVIKINKFIYFSYIDIIISVYGIMFIYNDIINQIIIRLFILETSLILKRLTTSVVYWFICLDMLSVLLYDILSDLL